MIRCFRSSKLILAIAALLSVGGAAAVFCLRPTFAPWLNLITAVLILGLGFVVGSLVSNMVATNQNAKLLSILHIELDPARFIAAYRGVPAKLPKASGLKTVASAYLAAGYAAAGDYETAVKTIVPAPAAVGNEKNALALRALVHDSLCEFALLRGDTNEADAQLALLADVMQRASVMNPDLLRNYRPTVFLYEQWRKVLQNEPANEKALSEQLQKTAIMLRRLEAQFVMARSHALRKNNGAAKELLKAIIETGGKTHFVADAKAALENPATLGVFDRG